MLLFFQYGHAQIQSLPTGGYRWAKKEEKRSFLENILENPSDFRSNSEDTGYICEVDLEYPDSLHDLHSDMPLAPEHIAISKDKICPLMKTHCPYGDSYISKKLVGTLKDKKKYVLHYQILKLYISMGLKIKRLHRLLAFKQRPFMQDYISHIAELRLASKNEFEKSCLKKLANSNYGKMIENTRKYKDVRICQTTESFLEAISSPLFLSFKIYNQNLVICFLQKSSIFLRSCHAIGLSILDLSKLHMYDLYYNHIIPDTKLSPIDNTLSIMMSDTDSFLFSFKKKTTNEFLSNIEHIMDFSNYPKDHTLFSRANAGQLGYLKDEMKGEAEISGVVALKSKCYSIKSRNAISKCKGIPKVATNKLKFKHYKQTLLKKETFYSKFARISSKDHEVSTVSFKRKSLSFYDDKRFYLCNIHSLPYGHYKLRQDEDALCHCN